MNLNRIKDWTRRNLKWIILFIAIIGFLALAEDVWNKDFMNGDVIGYNLISRFLISDFATPIAKFITNFGSATILIIITLICLICFKDKKVSISISVNLAIATVLNFTLKNILQRPRPTEYRLINENGYSFPSGHSMVSMAFYGFFIFLAYKYFKNKKIRNLVIGLLSILIVLIGVSRIYLGVHYTSDVLGGFLIAISYLIIYESIIEKFIFKREE